MLAMHPLYVIQTSKVLLATLADMLSFLLGLSSWCTKAYILTHKVLITLLKFIHKIAAVWFRLSTLCNIKEQLIYVW